MNAAYVIVGASLAPPSGARLSPSKARSSAAELLKILEQDDPPRVIHCGSTGCSYLSATDVRGQTEDN